MIDRVYIVQRKIRDDRRGDLGPSPYKFPVSAHTSRASANAEAKRRNKASSIYTYNVRSGSLRVDQC